MSSRKATRRPNRAPTQASSPKITRSLLRLAKRIAGGEKFNTLAPYAKVASAFEVPLWVMLIPNLPREIYAAESDGLTRLVKHVESFIGNPDGSDDTRSQPDFDLFENAFSNARGIVAVLQELAARNGLNASPGFQDSIARSLGSALDMLDAANAAVFPARTGPRQEGGTGGRP